MSDMTVIGVLRNAGLMNDEKIQELLKNGKMRSVRNCGEKTVQKLAKLYNIKPPDLSSRGRPLTYEEELARVRTLKKYLKTRMKRVEEKERLLTLANTR